MSLALPRFQQSSLLVDDNGLPSVPFHIWWDQFAARIEQSVNDLSAIVADIAALQAAQTTLINDLAAAVADIAAAQAAADAAQADATTGITNAAAAQTTANTGVTNAATAQTTANTVKRDDSISNSWTSPGTVLSAADAGSSATVTIANHTRKYSDVTSVSVTGNTVTGLAYSTSYDIYYDQTSRAGGAVTYHATTDPNAGMANSVAGRHWCGNITTPAAAGAPTS